ncbi:uncharacterized protein LOC34617310 [Cyclospora cayetanensis]|uniref:Uncharacterized protein LOC34617310 n=1 Tax=Cyclospora cayetanensis TaxID=88456 RepID=A0A6P6S015_9EIME|nr:uncharacterized protein LOC34617310 [Cyclospora cayetanensis]
MAFLFRGWEDVEGESLGRDSASSSAVYTELRLRGLIRTEEEKERLLELCSGTADAVWTCGSVQRHACSTVFHVDRGVLVGGLHAKRTAEAVRVCAVETSQSIRGLLGMLGFRRVGMVHVKADVFHFKPKTSRHVVLLVQRHFLDPAHQQPLWEGGESCWLVELLARRSCEAATAAAEAALAAVADTLKPVVMLRKVDPKDYAEAEARAMRAAAL